jgi:hypothetical protein
MRCRFDLRLRGRRQDVAPAAARSHSIRASTVTSGRLVAGSDERCSLPGNRCHTVESLVIDDDSIVSLATAATSGAIFIRRASGARKPPSRTTSSSTAFSNGWTHPRDNSRSRLDLVFDALEHAAVDARQRKIVWADGKRLSIEQSAERIHAGASGRASRPH